MLKQIVKSTLRIPAFDGPSGNSRVLACQFDSALMAAGFKLSGEAMAHFSVKDPVAVGSYMREVLATVHEMVGAHRNHNTYFRDFPKHVPNTEEFWRECILTGLQRSPMSKDMGVQLTVANLKGMFLAPGSVYGAYQHSYEEMLAAHEKLIPALKYNYKILALGRTLAEEIDSRFLSLASSAVPLSPENLAFLTELAKLSESIPERIPVREHRAVINAVRVARNLPLIVDTVTDVLRLAAQLSGGDVTLEKPTKYRSFSRPVRRLLLAGIDDVLATAAWKIGDVSKNREMWKRLGEKLHPFEYKFERAKSLFSYAYGESDFLTLASRIETAFGKKDFPALVGLLGTAPGILFRNLDRLLEAGCPEGLFFNALADYAPKVSGRVLISVWEHFVNRSDVAQKRIFTNRKGKAWVTPDKRKPLHEDAIVGILSYLETEIASRLPAMANLVVDESVRGVALPLSEKSKSEGFGVLPRGSVCPVGKSPTLRFFIYWKEETERTDYDLSVELLGKDFQSVGSCSFRSLTYGDAMKHSGDLTSAPNGASEFIDVELSRLPANVEYIVPTINKFAGDDFKTAAECFFGFMERNPAQKGQPFEPKTVKMKSDLRGEGGVALPLMFKRTSSGWWEAKWLHLFLKGHANFNMLENNRLTTNLLTSTIAGREYATLGLLTSLLAKKCVANDAVGKTYIGFEAPEGAEKSYTPQNFYELIPE